MSLGSTSPAQHREHSTDSMDSYSSSSQCFGIMDLPDEIQIMILQKLPFQQLIQLKKVSKHFANLIQNESTTLIKGVALPNTFPKPNTMKALQWLSSKGNLEASIKLGIGHLYHEGLVDTAQNRKQNSLTAAKYFTEIEKNSQLHSPITWIFIRPPWSSAAVCRKAYVFKNILAAIKDGNNHPHLLYSVGKILNMFEDDSEKRKSAKQWLQQASDKGLPDAKYELWCMELNELDKNSSLASLFATRSPGVRLSMIRKLREIAATGFKPAKLQLCSLYALGHFGGLPSSNASRYVREMFSKSYSTKLRRMFQVQSCLKPSMRYILVDWLVEVATMKDFGSEMLHATIKCVDSYLLLREVPRSYLQLLGIACMVICTRAIEKDLLTIREAVWLTDSTYKYDELVRMMEDVVATLRGNIKEITAHDYLTILFNSSEADKKSQTIARFISDTSLLHVDTASFSPALTASASVLIANLTTNSSNPWSLKMKQYTGFTEQQLAPIALAIHENCLSEEPPFDHRNLKLDAVEERYSQSLYGPIKRSQIVSYDKLNAFFESSIASRPEISAELELPRLFLPDIVPSNVTVENQSSTTGAGDETLSVETCFDHAAVDYQGTASDDDDAELDTDTPPTFSCAYLVKPDTKTRKRIREKCIRKESHSTQPHKTLPSSHNPAGNSFLKVFQPKNNSLQTIHNSQQRLPNEKGNKPTPNMPYSSRKVSDISGRENVCPKKFAKVSNEHCNEIASSKRAPPKQTSTSRQSRSPMRL